jgi:hypothetical protein
MMYCRFVQRYSRVLKDLIAEATATKNAIDEAVVGIDEAVTSTASLKANGNTVMLSPSETNDVDLFAFDGGYNNKTSTEVSLAIPSVASEPQQYTFSSGGGTGTSTEESGFASAPPAMPAAYTRPTLVTNDERNQSTTSIGGFDLNNFMGSGGGGYLLSPQTQQQSAGTPAAISGLTSFGSSYGSSPVSSSLADPTAGDHGALGTLAASVGSGTSLEEVNELRRRAKEASDVAHDAERSCSVLEAQLDEARRIADEAVAKHRHEAEAAAAAAEEEQEKKGKRKGFLGRGKKNKTNVVRAPFTIYISWLENSHSRCSQMFMPNFT